MHAKYSERMAVGRGGDGTERQRGHMVKAFESALGNVNDLFKPPFTI